jgi:hypothetical protein
MSHHLGTRPGVPVRNRIGAFRFAHLLGRRCDLRVGSVADYTWGWRWRLGGGRPPSMCAARVGTRAHAGRALIPIRRRAGTCGVGASRSHAAAHRKCLTR